MLRLSWPSYTNEAIFLFHATALVFASFQHGAKGDALYYKLLCDKTFNPLFLSDFGWLFCPGDGADHLDIWLRQPAAKQHLPDLTNQNGQNFNL